MTIKYLCWRTIASVAWITLSASVLFYRSSCFSFLVSNKMLNFSVERSSLISPKFVADGNICNVLRLVSYSGRNSTDKQRAVEQHPGICLFVFLK